MLEKDLTPKELKEAKSKRKSWESIETEESTFDQQLWLLTSALKPQYTDALAVLTTNLYHLHRLYEIRYIKYAETHIPRLKQNIKSKHLPNIIEYIKFHYQEFGIKSFDTFARVEERRLRNMLDHIIGKENREFLLKKGYKFDVLDYKFFLFLLDIHNGGVYFE